MSHLHHPWFGYSTGGGAGGPVLAEPSAVANSHSGPQYLKRHREEMTTPGSCPWISQCVVTPSSPPSLQPALAKRRLVRCSSSSGNMDYFSSGVGTPSEQQQQQQQQLEPFGLPPSLCSSPASSTTSSSAYYNCWSDEILELPSELMSLQQQYQQYQQYQLYQQYQQ